MFNVGDRVKVVSGFETMEKDSFVTIERSYFGSAIGEEFCDIITDRGDRFTGLYYTRFIRFEELSREALIERKVRKMYERQPYFSRYRSGQSS